MPEDDSNLFKIIGDPLDKSPQSVELSELLIAHIKNRNSVPDSGDVCIDACYQYILDALKEKNVKLHNLKNFPHGYPHILTKSSSKRRLSGLRFVKIFYSSNSNINWTDISIDYRGKGAVGAMLFANLIANHKKGITVSRNGWPTNMAPGTLLQLWKDEQTFNEVRDTGNTNDVGHGIIFISYKDNDPNIIIVADQYKLNAEYKYPTYNLTYVIAGKPSKIEVIPLNADTPTDNTPTDNTPTDNDFIEIPGFLGRFKFCSNEYEHCNFTGTRTVVYGENGKFFSKVATDGVDCGNHIFGDPIFGVVKKCYVSVDEVENLS